MNKNNKHNSMDLRQMQLLPLEAKIQITKERISTWYEAWTRFEIFNEATGKTRFVTLDTRDSSVEPELKKSESIKSILPGSVYVSFSGGKDSTVLKHIVDSMYDDVPSVFINTGLEYPEIQKFAKSQKNVVVIYPEMRFDEVLKKYGYPVASKEIAKCVYYAKKVGTKYGDFCAKRLNGEEMHNCKKSQYNCEKWKFLLDANFDVGPQCCGL